MIEKIVFIKKLHYLIEEGTSLLVQWLCSQCRGPRFGPWSGNSSHTLQRRLKILCAATETQCSQVKRYINKYLKKRKIQRTEVEGGREEEKEKEGEKRHT